VRTIFDGLFLHTESFSVKQKTQPGNKPDTGHHVTLLLGNPANGVYKVWNSGAP